MLAIFCLSIMTCTATMPSRLAFITAHIRTPVTRFRLHGSVVHDVQPIATAASGHRRFSVDPRQGIAVSKSLKRSKPKKPSAAPYGR